MRAHTESQLQERFREVYDETYRDALRFAARRVQAADAEDVVAEAFTVVWRRIDECPPDTSDARAWVFGITRHLLLNAARSGRRHDALGVRLASMQTASSAPPIEVAARVDFARAWAHLPDADQEVLALHVFDELDATQAAAVLSISPATYRVRLSRARSRLRGHLDDAAERDTDPPRERRPVDALRLAGHPADPQRVDAGRVDAHPVDDSTSSPRSSAPHASTLPSLP